MIIIPKTDSDPQQIKGLIDWLKDKGYGIHVSEGANQTIIGLIGDTTKIDIDLIRSMDIVADVKRIQEPYKNANRKFHPDDTVVDVGGVKLGGGNFQIMAGPCSVESEEQICALAEQLSGMGVKILRGGAFKPRTSPYAFQGLRGKGIEYLLEAKRATGMKIVTEIMDISQLDLFADVDIIQVGARNMQNFELLKELGHSLKPILLKRGMASTLEELLMSAEYIMAGGDSQVILCERGIRTFETATRNTLDLSAIPVLKGLTHLPIVVDPSHSTGKSKFVPPMAFAAAACGADGLIIEVHNNPTCALCDGQQSLTPESFGKLNESLKRILPFAYKYND